MHYVYEGKHPYSNSCYYYMNITASWIIWYAVHVLRTYAGVVFSDFACENI